jgi:polar amino acid transport system substrate-binding protein
MITCSKTIVCLRLSLGLILSSVLDNAAAQQQVLHITSFGQGGPMETAAASLLSATYKKLGVQVEFINYPGNRALKESNEGRADGELLRKAGLSEEYPNLIQVMVPLATSHTMAFASDPALELAQGWESLRNYSFAYQRGAKLIEANTIGFPRALPQTDIKVAFRQLQNKRIDLVLMDEAAGLQLIQDLGLQQSVTMLTPPLAHTPLFHYLHKKHAGLAAKLEAALREQK